MLEDMKTRDDAARELKRKQKLIKKKLKKAGSKKDEERPVSPETLMAEKFFDSIGKKSLNESDIAKMRDTQAKQNKQRSDEIHEIGQNVAKVVKDVNEDMKLRQHDAE